MENFENKYERAAKRVKELKGFYRHLKIFVIVNGVLFLLKSGILHSTLPDGFPTEPYYYDWINANLLIWGVILLVHALYTFRYKLTFLKKWEERQIQKYMEEDQSETNDYK